MPKSRKNPKRKMTRCGCSQGWRDFAHTIPCRKCNQSGMIPEPKHSR